MRAGWILSILVFSQVWAGDWPQFLGPRRDGSTPEKISASWPAGSPRTAWRVEVGEGFAGPVVSDGKVIVFHRVDGEERIEALEAGSGKTLWEYGYPTRYRDAFGFDEGPRATPSVSNGRVFCMGAEGMITAVDFETGERLWQVDAKREFGTGKGFFGMACSPLVERNLVLLNIGGRDGAGIVALDAESGRLRWKATDHEAGYSSPVVAEVKGKRCAFFLTREGLAVLEPGSGGVIAEFPWRARMHASVNAATPLVIGNRIFISASYGTGAALLEFDPPKLTKVWSGDGILSNHYATSVHHDGFLYGYDGRQERGPDFVCIELATGKVRWRERDFGAGTVSLAGGDLLVLKETGELLVVVASPKGFKPRARAQIAGETRAYPAISDGFLYVRDKMKLFCVDLRPR